jgi:hypothetical protein
MLDGLPAGSYHVRAELHCGLVVGEHVDTGQFVGKSPKTTPFNNCCITTSSPFQNWGLPITSCGQQSGPFLAPALGAVGCTNVQNRQSQQLTFCRR